MPPPVARLLTHGILVVALAILSGGAATHSHAAPGDCTTECFVDAVNGDDLLHHGTSPADAFKSLQRAVDTVEVGGTVRAAPGLYDPNFTEVDKSVTILGAQAGVDPLLRDPTDATAESIVQSNTGFFITGIGAEVEVDGFTLRSKTPGSSGGVSAGSYLDGSVVTNVGADLTIENNVFSGLNISVASSVGRNPSSLRVVGNLFSGGGTGILVAGDRGPATLTVDANTFRSSTSFGVSLLVWSGAIITNNTIDSPTGTSDPIWVGGCADCTISGNTILSPAAFDGISLFGANGFASTDCTIEDNVISNPTRAANYGIWVGLATGTVIRGNTISGAREAGIATDPAASIVDNTVTSIGGANTTGIYLRRATAGATVTGNTVSGASVGIDVDPSAGSANSRIERNAITGNATGLRNRSMTSVAATCNWWGDVSGPAGEGPGSGDPVSASVTFSPWLLGPELATATCGVPATPSPTPTPTQTPTPTPTPTHAAEQCGNCIDDDGDALVDRGDPDCPARADGAGAGVAEAKRGKSVVKCQAKLGKTGFSFAVKRQKLLLGCVANVQKCLQRSPGDAACLLGATEKCGKGANAIGVLEAKLARDAEKSCAGLRPEERSDPVGLGFDAERSACAAVGVPVLDSAADLARCIGRRHACESDLLLGLAAPRTRELLGLAGLGAVLSSCAAPGADGGGEGLGDPVRGKALGKCERAMAKASVALVKQRLIGWTGCVGAVAKCVQQSPGDSACLAEARAKCAKLSAKLEGAKGPEAKAFSAIGESCPAGLLVEVVAPVGLGYGAVANACSALGVPSLASARDVAECLARDHRCRAANLLDASVPRASEYLSLGGLAP